MFSGHKIVGYYIMSMFVVTTVIHLDTETKGDIIIFRIFFGSLKLYNVVALPLSQS